MKNSYQRLLDKQREKDAANAALLSALGDVLSYFLWPRCHTPEYEERVRKAMLTHLAYTSMDDPAAPECEAELLFQWTEGLRILTAGKTAEDK